MIKTENVMLKGSMDRLKSIMSQKDIFQKQNKKFKADMKVIARSITSILNLEDSYDIKKSFGAGEFYIELYFDVNNNAFFIRCFVTDGWGPLEALGDIERQKKYQEQTKLRNAEYKRLFPKFITGNKYHVTTFNGFVKLKTWGLKCNPFDSFNFWGMDSEYNDLYSNEYSSSSSDNFISKITEENIIDCISDYSKYLLEKSSEESYNAFVNEILNNELMIEDLTSENKILDFIKSAIFDEVGIPKYKKVNNDYFKHIGYEALYSSLASLDKHDNWEFGFNVNFINNLKNIGIWRELSGTEKENILSVLLRNLEFKTITKISTPLRQSGVILKDTELFDFLFEKYDISSPTIKIDFIVKSGQNFSSLTNEEFESLDNFYKFKYLNLNENII